MNSFLSQFILLTTAVVLCSAVLIEVSTDDNSAKLTPQTNFVSTPSNRTVVLSESVVLPCVPRDSNEVKWYYKGRLIEDDTTKGVVLGNGFLRITRASKEHTGRYTCKALHEGKEVAVSAWLKVTPAPLGEKCSPSIRFKSPKPDLVNKRLNLAAGQRLFQFHCRVRKGTKIEYFEKDGKRIPHDERGRIQLSFGGKRKHGTLTIRSANLADSGRYTCKAKKGHCTSQRHLWLIVTNHTTDNLAQHCGASKLDELPPAALSFSGGKMMNKQPATPTSVPWYATLSTGATGPFCGGALIDHRWVVTAAHCLLDFRDSHGVDLDVKELRVDIGGRTYPVSVNYTHRNYDKRSKNNDIALLRLQHPAEYNNRTTPICFGPPRLLDHLMQSGDGLAIGRNTDVTPQTMEAMHLPLVHQATCRASIDARTCRDCRVTDNMFCAGYRVPFHDACNGDSGGPFVKQWRGKWYLVGVISWGDGCHEAGKFGFYTAVWRYYSWIMQHLLRQ